MPGRIPAGSIDAGRAIARRLLRAFGLERIHHPSFTALMRREGVATVLDIGANEGQFARDIRERGYRGRIVSFEPVSTAFLMLDRHAQRDPLWDTYQLGVGDVAGERVISVAASSVFSSFKPPSAYAARTFTGLREDHSETVHVVRLDAFLTAHSDLIANAYLKIDTQGFEREVLLGLGDILPRIKAVQMELPLRELYRGQATMVEMIEWMKARGFEIAMAKENGFDWRAMRLLELDVVFVRAD